MQSAQFVCFTNGFWTNSSRVFTFPESGVFRRFPAGFPTNAVIFFEFPNEGDFVSFTKVFGRNGVAADTLSDDENSSIFLQDFDETGFGHRFSKFFAFRLFS